MNQPKAYELDIIQSVAAYEREAGHPLPAASFYKALAVAIMKKYNLAKGGN
jgi:hypothetical protein